MESQPQNPEFRINPENFCPWRYSKSTVPIDAVNIMPLAGFEQTT